MDEYNRELCDERHHQIDNKLDRIISNLEGNGKPGIKMELDRLKQQLKVMCWIAGLFVARMVWMLGEFIYERVQ